LNAQAAPVIALDDRREVRSRRRPVHIEVAKNELVGTCMDLNTLATEAIYANGAAIEIALKALPPSPERFAIQRALLDAHASLKRLVLEARAASARYESAPPTP